jgi:membrane-associated phospholipid phosphatase
MSKFSSRSLLIAFIFLQCVTFLAQAAYRLQWGREGLILGVGFISAIASSEVDDAVSPLTEVELDRLDKKDVNVFDRGATAYYSKNSAQVSNIVLATCISSPVLLLGARQCRNHFGIIALMYGETMLFATFLPSYAKGGVQRIRPFIYNPSVAEDQKLNAEARRSFFSGHTTLAFSSAVFFSTVYAHYYPNSILKKYVWAGSLLTAGIVGYSRVRAGAHFPTDVLVGAAIGSLIGYFIPRLHENSNASLTVMPVLYNNSAGLSLCWQLK